MSIAKIIHAEDFNQSDFVIDGRGLSKRIDPPVTGNVTRTHAKFGRMSIRKIIEVVYTGDFRRLSGTPTKYKAEKDVHILEPSERSSKEVFYTDVEVIYRGGTSTPRGSGVPFNASATVDSSNSFIGDTRVHVVSTSNTTAIHLMITAFILDR